MSHSLKQALVLTMLAGCGSGTSSGSIGAEGGTVSGANGASVTIPAGALAGPVAITATALASPTAPAATTVVGSAVTLAPEGQQFTTPVTVTLPLTLPMGKTAASVIIYTAAAGTTTYSALTTKVVDATHVSAQVTHFSNFVPAVPGGCSTNGDCSMGKICVSGVCQASGGGCSTNSDCVPGQNCVSGVCK